MISQLVKQFFQFLFALSETKMEASSVTVNYSFLSQPWHLRFFFALVFSVVQCCGQNVYFCQSFSSSRNITSTSHLKFRAKQSLRNFHGASLLGMWHHCMVPTVSIINITLISPHSWALGRSPPPALTKSLWLFLFSI